MDAKMQIQSLKTQIENIKLQIDNIEIQYNNKYIGLQAGNLMTESLIGEQLFNLSIQLLNSGINSFNIGKKINLDYDNYLNKLKQISQQINELIEENNFQPIQPLYMMPPPIYINNQTRIIRNPNSNHRKNIVFDDRSGEIINIQAEYGITVAELLEKYYERLYSRNINNIMYKIKFLYDGQTLEDNDLRKVENVFKSNVANIWALKIQN